MPVTNVGSRWSSGDLIFYEKNVSLGTIGNILTIGDDAVTISSATNDINFAWLGLTTGTFTLDAGAHTLAMTGMATSTDGAVTITDATATSSTTTGALIVTGGIATAADITCGDDLFMASSGAVINFNSGDVTLTHSSNLLTLDGGALAVGASGTGQDVTFYGADAGAYMKWDASEKRLYLYAADESGANLSPLHAVATLDNATGYYYGLQSDVTKTGTGGIDDCTCVTAYLNQASNDAFTVTGRFCPLQVLISGSGTVGTISKTGNGAVHAAWIANRGTQKSTDSILCVHNQSAATATSAVELDINGTITYAFDFGGTVSDGWTSGDLTGADEYAAFDEYALIPVKVDGVTGTLYLMAAHTWKAVSI